MLEKEIKSQRKSNLELFRIVLMFGIVAHHYIVHSGLLKLAYASGELNARNIFIVLLGAWGKIGVNCFILITGYFMCKSKISLKKFLRLFLEVEFYYFIIYIIFVLSGYSKFSLVGMFESLNPIKGITSNFVGCFLIFYLLIPFLNVTVLHMDKKRHFILLTICFFIFSILASIPNFAISLNYVIWFVVVYFFGAFIRLYLPRQSVKRLKISIIATLMCVCFCVMSVVFGFSAGKEWTYWLVDDSNKVLAVATSISLFMLFINIKMKHHPFINGIAASVFGVLLIHDNGVAMRKWLWVDTLHNAQFYGSSWLYVHAITMIIIVFFASVAIDRVRMMLLERPLFKAIGAKADRVDVWIRGKI